MQNEADCILTALSILLDAAHQLPGQALTHLNGWLRSTVVERRSFAGELLLFCASPAANG